MRRDRGSRFVRAAGVLALAALGTGACTPLDDAMVAIFGRSMRDQPSFDPYENPRLPAENSVPFASGNYPAQIGDVGVGQAEGLAMDLPPFAPMDMAPPGSEVVRGLENPVPADEASLEKGRVLYDRYCTVCHGAAGQPSEAPIRDKMPVVQAWPLSTGGAVGYSDGYIYGMIRVGRGVMPAYGHRVTHFERWHIVNYVRYLQQQQAGGAGAGGSAPGEAPASDTAAGAAAADTAGGDAEAPGAGAGDTAAGAASAPGGEG